MAAGPRIELNSQAADTIDGRQIRAVAFQAVRLEYVQRVLNRLDLGGEPRRALVVGSGKGLLAHGLAGLCTGVTAVDPSTTATAIARDAGAAQGLSHVTYATAAPEQLGQLPLGEGTFDLVYCADTFEVTADLDRTVAQAARLLSPDGVLCYDTVNRTVPARLVYLGAFQALPLTRIMPPGRYAAERLRTPAEMGAALHRHGLRQEDVCGFQPESAPALVRAVLARRAGRIADEQVPDTVGFHLAPQGRPLVTYLGCARREGAGRSV